MDGEGKRGKSSEDRRGKGEEDGRMLRRLEDKRFRRRCEEEANREERRKKKKKMRDKRRKVTHSHSVRDALPSFCNRSHSAPCAFKCKLRKWQISFLN